MSSGTGFFSGPYRIRRMPPRQRQLLDELMRACENWECEGGCNLGWVRVEGRTIAVARRLESGHALSLTIGPNGWTCAHLTRLGRSMI
jgi:hypothetical protein